MDPETKVQVGRKPRVAEPTEKRPVMAHRGSKSGHVIDLRKQDGPNFAPPEPKPKPRPARPQLRAVEESEPFTPEPSELDLEVGVDEPELEPMRQSPLPSRVDRNQRDFVDTSAAGRRFWPAFGRFMLLLVVFGALIAGAIYIYLNYYQA